MKQHSTAKLPQGFQCASKLCGLKKEGKDLALIYSRVPASAAGVFTQNQFPGAPIFLGRELIKKGMLQAIVVNSKVSNVATGAQGLENARRMGVAVAREFNIPAEFVMMSSTGVIAKQLPIELIEQGIQGISRELVDDPLVAAQGIMTTDTYPKAISLAVGPATLTIIAKGSGMIEPNMATMLVYILTDAQISAPALDQMLREAVRDSFNMLSVDSDMSTSDTCLILANGLAGPVDAAEFLAALKFATLEMTRMLARDGEGATKLLIAHIQGAISESDARTLAKSLINSPLIKTMAYGADPNIGRILMALGKCLTCTIQPEKIEITINSQPVFKNLNKVNYDETELRRNLSGDPVEITVNLNCGPGVATAYGCDLTEGYIRENAAYFSS
jgi:glutamate N-acetyltransferase/amino-acid N-acetyltransferase